MMTRRQLERWVWREVTGEPALRKPAGRATQMSGGPARNWRYRAWIRSLPCAVCGLAPAREAAHTGDHALGSKASDYSCIPLCADCHTLGPCAYHRLGRAAFEARHYIDIAALVKRSNRLWFEGLQLPA